MKKLEKIVQSSEFKVRSALREAKQLANKLSKMNAVETGLFLDKAGKEIDTEFSKNEALYSILFLLLQGIHSKLMEAIQRHKNAKREN